jgi:O-glycosyl hydrolase
MANRRNTLCRNAVSSILALCLGLLQVPGNPLVAQAAVLANAQHFSFASDGPSSQVWGARAEEVPRVFFPERLPAFFSKTIVLDAGVPQDATVNWIFTGGQGGFTVEVNHATVRVYQRFYDSYGLIDSHSANPERVVQETVAIASDPIHSITVVLDSHLLLSVLVNDSPLVQQSCMMDVSRHQLQFLGPRARHVEVAGALLPAQASDTVVSVDPTRRHQTIYGFGGSPSIPAYASLSEQGKKRYWSILKRYNLLIDREYPMGTNLLPDMSNLDHLADAKPHYYGDNFPNGEVTSFAYNAEALKLGSKVIYEMWALPAWATQEDAAGRVFGPDGRPQKGVANPREWAMAMATYARMEKEKTGRAPDVLGVQNEIKQPKEVVIEMVKTLRRELDAAGFKDVKIQMPDAPFTASGIEFANTLKSDGEAWSEIDFAASHEYNFQNYITDMDAFDDQLKALRKANGDKPFLATEIGVNSTRLQIASYRVAFNVGQLYHKNMTLLDSIGLGYCWLILDVEQPNFGATRSLLVPDRYHEDIPVASSYQLRVLGAFSRHLQEGMVRVDAVSTNPDLLVTAYESNEKTRTVIAANRSTSPQTMILSWPGTTWKELERVSQYAENAEETVPDKIVVQPGEIVTLSTMALARGDFRRREE